MAHIRLIEPDIGLSSVAAKRFIYVLMFLLALLRDIWICVFVHL